MHEAQLHENNCFVTLTYAPEHLPEHGVLRYDDAVKFMKRLRRHCGSGIRSYGCAEYGAKFGRPHYHLCIFNYDFNDKIQYSTTPTGFPLYTSPLLQSLWTDPITETSLGFTTVGAFSFETAAYVARYVMKKITGDLAEPHYETISEQGEVINRPPEKAICVSRRPGLGRPWLDKYTSDVYPSDYVIVDGKKCRPPKYYDYRFEIEYPDDFHKIKVSRKNKALMHEGNNTADRLAVREEIVDLKLALLKRGFENAD